MIVRISAAGRSFKGLATYLTHDPGARTARRVAWTHTLNLANDHVPSAIDEMLRTSRNAELLKQEAGIRAGGRSTRNTVKHISLNWPPAGAPTKAQMIEAAETFLRHMNWQGHQAVLVAHNDRHPHLHLALNAVHPETGLKIDEAFERRRAQAWALGYEQRQGAILCRSRLRRPEDREKAPPRNAWVAFEGTRLAFEQDEERRRGTKRHSLAEAASQYTPAADEWRQLKEIQRREREAFFAVGKAEFSALRLNVYRRLREAFRPRWAELYAARKDGREKNALAGSKADLVAQQKAALEGRRDEACAALRTARDTRYRNLLDAQRAARQEFRRRREAGLDNAAFLQSLREQAFAGDIVFAFGDAAGAAHGSQGDHVPAGSGPGADSRPILVTEKRSRFTLLQSFLHPEPGRAGGGAQRPIILFDAAAADMRARRRGQPQPDRFWKERDRIRSWGQAATEAVMPILLVGHSAHETGAREPPVNSVIATLPPVRTDALDQGGMPPTSDAFDDYRDKELAIETMYRWKLSGARRLPRHARAAALRAAREWRQGALRALQDKRAAARHERRILRLWQNPPSR